MVFPIYSVTPQNEPLNRGNSSMYMGWEEQNAFIKNALGLKIQTRGNQYQDLLYDHNYDYDNHKEETKDQIQYPLHIYCRCPNGNLCLQAQFIIIMEAINRSYSLFIMPILIKSWSLPKHLSESGMTVGTLKSLDRRYGRSGTGCSKQLVQGCHYLEFNVGFRKKALSDPADAILALVQ